MTARDTKLIQYLNEAYGKEKQLETALEAHIAMTTRASYRERLRRHLAETKRHAREVERRIKKLGGVAEVVPLPGPEAISRGASSAVELGARALAAAQGPLHAVRGTGEQEKMLKNAKSEYSEEHEEIATYSAIEQLASDLGDRETRDLVKAIRREEERMASFLAKLIPSLTRAVVQEEVPASERAGRPRSSKRRSRAGAASTSRRAGSSAGRASAAGAAAPRAGSKGAAKRTGAAKRSAAAKRTSAAGATTTGKKRAVAKGTSARRTEPRSVARRASASRSA